MSPVWKQLPTSTPTHHESALLFVSGSQRQVPCRFRGCWGLGCKSNPCVAVSPTKKNLRESLRVFSVVFFLQEEKVLGGWLCLSTRPDRRCRSRTQASSWPPASSCAARPISAPLGGPKGPNPQRPSCPAGGRLSPFFVSDWGRVRLGCPLFANFFGGRVPLFKSFKMSPDE